MNSQTMRLMYISFTESQSNHIYVLSFTYKLAPRSSSTYIQYRVVELCKTRLGPPEGYQACVFGECPTNGGSQRGQLVLGEIRWESGNLGNQNVSVNAVKLVETKWHHHFLQTCSFLYTSGYFLQFVCLLIYRLPNTFCVELNKQFLCQIKEILKHMKKHFLIVYSLRRAILLHLLLLNSFDLFYTRFKHKKYTFCIIFRKTSSL